VKIEAKIQRRNEIINEDKKDHLIDSSSNKVMPKLKGEAVKIGLAQKQWLDGWNDSRIW